MARIIEERWLNVAFDVVREEITVPLNGEKQTFHTLVLVQPAGDGGQHIIRVPLDGAGRDKLVQKLTGVVLPSLASPIIAGPRRRG